MSSFGSSLNIGTSAIHAAQRGLDVTGQNIANSATPGYTRQRVDLESIGGPGVPAFWSRYDGVGEGVKITGVTRMNDEFLAARARNSNAALGSMQEQEKTMAAIERTVAEPGELGLQSKLADFWNAWGKAANSPSKENSAPRSLVYERATAVANQLNHMSNSLQTQWQDTGSELTANVNAINAMAQDVAKLNEAIRNNNIARVPANELLDQRDVLIARISELTGATVKPAELDQGKDFNSQAVDVFIGDKKLVDATTAYSLEISDPNDGVYPDGETPEPVVVQWAEDGPNAGEDAAVVTGRVAGQLTSMNTTIPKYLAQFDAVAVQVAEAVNEQQAEGYTVDGDMGDDLFEAADGVTITAANIRLVPGTNGESLAISEGDINGDPPALDGNNAAAMAAKLGEKGGADATYSSLIVSLGTEAESISRNVTVQENVVKQAEDARDNVSGVSLNEEMTNLIRFQHSFSAAAKFVGVIDQTLETLINMVR